MDVSIFNVGRVHFRNTEMKGLVARILPLHLRGESGYTFNKGGNLRHHHGDIHVAAAVTLVRIHHENMSI